MTSPAVSYFLPFALIFGLFTSFFAAMKTCPAFRRFAVSSPGIAPLRWASLFLFAFQARQPLDAPAVPSMRGSADGRQSPTKGRVSRLGDWVAPVIVLFLLITMSLAILGLLLGER
jgi:hypothetical protein